MKWLKHTAPRVLGIGLAMLLVFTCVRMAPLSCRQARCACECCVGQIQSQSCCEEDHGQESTPSKDDHAKDPHCHCNCAVAPVLLSLTPITALPEASLNELGMIYVSVPALLTVVFEPTLPPPIPLVMRA